MFDWKTFGKKISAAGTLLASGSVTGAFLTLPTDTPAPWIKPLHMACIGTILIGGALSGAGKLIAVFSNGDVMADSSVGGRSGTFPVAFLLLALMLPLLSGCTTASGNRQKGEQIEANAYEQAYKNESERADSLDKANVINHTRRMDLELKSDLATLATQSTLNAPQWTTAAVAAETTRLQALHDSKIAAYAQAMQASRDLRTKNEASNLATARKLRDALNPPAPVLPVSQSAQIQATTGTQPAAVLIQP